MRGTVIHYAVVPPRDDHGACAAQVEGIRRYHLSTGYRDIAYGWLVCQHGGVFEGLGWGPNAANGSNELNRDYHSICWLGDQFTEPSAEALAAISGLLDSGPNARDIVRGHRDVHQTACPGDALHAWVAAGAVTVAPAVPTTTLGDDVILVGRSQQEPQTVFALHPVNGVLAAEFRCGVGEEVYGVPPSAAGYCNGTDGSGRGELPIRFVHPHVIDWLRGVQGFVLRKARV